MTAVVLSSRPRGGPVTVRPAPFRRLVALALLLAAASGPDPARATPRGILADSLATIVAGELRGAQVGILALSQDSGETLLAVREGDRFIPGSNQKLFTLGAFLLDRGPTARSNTRIEARGTVKRAGGGARPPEVSFRGDLVLRPSGMPDVVPLLEPGSRGLLDSLAALLRASGLRRFEGTLWVDRSLFAREAPPPGWAHDDLGYSYGAPLNPFLAHGNSMIVTASEENGRITLAVEPPGASLDVRDSGIAIGAQGEPGWLIPRWAFGTRTLELTGLVPRGGIVRRGVAVSDPDSAAAAWFLAALRREGVETKKVAVEFLPPREGSASRRGKRRDAPPASGAVAPGGAPAATEWSGVGGESLRVVAALRSPTVSEAVAIVAQQSLNTEAEAILRLLDPAPAAKGRREGLGELTRRVAEAGIDTADVSFLDGSGLSPMNLTTPRALVRWLAYVDAAPAVAGVFRASLPEPGKPGTLERRFATLPPGSTLHAKTGSLTNVASLSGYLTTAAGERIVFAMLVNGARRTLAAAREAEERLVGMLARVPRERAGRMPPPSGVPR